MTWLERVMGLFRPASEPDTPPPVVEPPPVYETADQASERIRARRRRRQGGHVPTQANILTGN